MKQFRIQLVVLAVLSFFILATTAMAIESRFASLDGQQEVGGGDIDGIGLAEIHLDKEQQQVCWKTSYENIVSPTAAHIHKAPAGYNGPIVIPLSPIENGCASTSDLLIRDIIQNPDQYYVNIHNSEYPAGAIRGQLSGFCDCEKSSVRPKFLDGDNKPVDFIKVTADRVIGRGRGAIEVKIDTDWVVTLVCKSAVETDVCRELLNLKGSSSDWKTNVPKDPKKGNGNDGKTTKESFASALGLNFQFCENKCDGVERSNDFSTTYKATVENSDGDGFTFKEIKGKVKLEISPVICKDKKSWTLIIAVDSTQKGNYNEDASDFDGDGVDNGVEKKTDTDGDKLSDYEEMLIGTDPTKKDTDGDGVDDKKDKFPLEKDRQ